MSLTEEKQLIEQAKSDPRAFGRLYDRYLDRIYSYAYRQTGNEMVAQDITAVTFEKALRHIRRHRWQEVSFGAWLYTIARNEIAQHYRQQKRLLDWQLRDPHSNGRLPETAVQQQEQQQQVHQALAQLKEDDRDILTQTTTFTVTLRYQLNSSDSAYLDVKLVEDMGSAGRGLYSRQLPINNGAGTLTTTLIFRPDDVSGSTTIRLRAEIKTDPRAIPLAITMPHTYQWPYQPAADS